MAFEFSQAAVRPVDPALDAFAQVLSSSAIPMHIGNVINGAEDPGHLWEAAYIYLATDDGSPPDPAASNLILNQVRALVAPRLTVDPTDLPPAAVAKYPDVQPFYVSVNYGLRSPGVTPAAAIVQTSTHSSPAQRLVEVVAVLGLLAGVGVLVSLPVAAYLKHKRKQRKARDA